MFFLSCPVVYLVMRCKSFNALAISFLHFLYHLPARAPEPKETGGVKAQKARSGLSEPCTVCLEVAGTVRYGLLVAPCLQHHLRCLTWPPGKRPRARRYRKYLRSYGTPYGANITQSMLRACLSVRPLPVTAFYSETRGRGLSLSTVATSYLSAAW